jgi:RraA family protein
MIGFQIARRTRKVDAAAVAKFRDLPVANISDSMSRMTAGGARLRPMHAGGVLAGPAFTVKTRPGDNLMIHKALNLAQPGDVLVVDGGGALDQALMGDIMTSFAEHLGLAGVVIDGAIRDVAAIRRRPFPVFARGVTHRGPHKNGPGEVGVPVSIGGMVVQPGDLVVGDEDGVLAVPVADAPAVIAGAQAQAAKEAEALTAIAEGRYDRSWLTAREQLMRDG